MCKYYSLLHLTILALAQAATQPTDTTTNSNINPPIDNLSSSGKSSGVVQEDTIIHVDGIQDSVNFADGTEVTSLDKEPTTKSAPMQDSEVTQVIGQNENNEEKVSSPQLNDSHSDNSSVSTVPSSDNSELKSLLKSKIGLLLPNDESNPKNNSTDTPIKTTIKQNISGLIDLDVVDNMTAEMSTVNVTKNNTFVSSIFSNASKIIKANIEREPILSVVINETGSDSGQNETETNRTFDGLMTSSRYTQNIVRKYTSSLTNDHTTSAQDARSAVKSTTDYYSNEPEPDTSIIPKTVTVPKSETPKPNTGIFGLILKSSMVPILVNPSLVDQKNSTEFINRTICTRKNKTDTESSQNATWYEPGVSVIIDNITGIALKNVANQNGIELECSELIEVNSTDNDLHPSVTLMVTDVSINSVSSDSLTSHLRRGLIQMCDKDSRVICPITSAILANVCRAEPPDATARRLEMVGRWNEDSERFFGVVSIRGIAGYVSLEDLVQLFTDKDFVGIIQNQLKESKKDISACFRHCCFNLVSAASTSKSMLYIIIPTVVGLFLSSLAVGHYVYLQRIKAHAQYMPARTGEGDTNGNAGSPYHQTPTPSTSDDSARFRLVNEAFDAETEL